MLFLDVYEENINWMDYEGIDVMGTLHAFYPEIVAQSGMVNTSSLIEGIKNGEKNAKECFKNLYKMPYKVNNLYQLFSVDTLKELQRSSGKYISAHGVEESKGGMHTLLMMLISNCIKVPSTYWGAFVEGPPNISPVRHGPYYVVVKDPYMIKSNLTFDKVDYIAVPFEENKEILSEKLSQLLDDNLLNEEQCSLFENKLKTYEELKQVLHEEVYLPILNKRGVSAEELSDQAQHLSQQGLFSNASSRAKNKRKHGSYTQDDTPLKRRKITSSTENKEEEQGNGLCP